MPRASSQMNACCLSNNATALTVALPTTICPSPDTPWAQLDGRPTDCSDSSRKRTLSFANEVATGRIRRIFRQHIEILLRQISFMKGGSIVCCGNAGYRAGSMMMGGTILILGDAHEALGEFMMDGEIYVAGKIVNLGQDAVDSTLREGDAQKISSLLEQHEIKPPVQPDQFKRPTCPPKEAD